MEQEISLIELLIMTIRFFKRHFKKYLITLILYVIAGSILLITYKPQYEINIPIYSSFFSKSELNDLVNLKLLNYTNKSLEIEKDTSTLSQFILVKINTTDTTILPQIITGITSRILNNPYSQKQIEKMCKYNRYLYEKLSDSLLSFFYQNKTKIDSSNQQTVYAINPVYTYEQIFQAKQKINKCKTKKGIIEIYPSLVNIKKNSNLIKNEALAFFFMFFLATMIFFFEDLFKRIT